MIIIKTKNKTILLKVKEIGQSEVQKKKNEQKYYKVILHSNFKSFYNVSFI